MKDDMDLACYFTGEIHTLIRICEGREHFEIQVQKGRLFTRNIEEVMLEVIAWMLVAEERNQWLLVNTVMNVLVPQWAPSFFTNRRLAFQKGLSSTDSNRLHLSGSCVSKAWPYKVQIIQVLAQSHNLHGHFFF